MLDTTHFFLVSILMRIIFLAIIYMKNKVLLQLYNGQTSFMSPQKYSELLLKNKYVI